MQHILRSRTPRLLAAIAAVFVCAVVAHPLATFAGSGFDSANASAQSQYDAAKTAHDHFHSTYESFINGGWNRATQQAQANADAVSSANLAAQAAAALATAAAAAYTDQQTAIQNHDTAQAAAMNTAIHTIAVQVQNMIPWFDDYHNMDNQVLSQTSAAKSAVQRSFATIETTQANSNRAAGNTTAADQAAQVAATANAQANASAATAADQANSCDFGHLGQCFLNLVYGVIKRVALFFLFVFSVFLGLAGLLFNWTIYITVFQFGNLIGNNPGMLAAWGVLRDLGNILLLFGFIFMGVSTILNLPGNEFTAKRALPALIIFAILLNFSLFAAEAVIDVSNGLASTFYRQANAGLCPAGADAVTCATQYGISGSIMTISGITQIFNPDEEQIIPGNTLGASIAIIGLTIFAAVVAFILLAAVFMFIARACYLAFLMTVSPIGFAGMAIPFMHKFAKNWWDQLLSQAFWAPIYVLLILITIKFMDGIRVALGGNGAETLASTFTASGISNVSLVVLFVLLIGFLILAQNVAKDMSAAGSSTATKWAGSIVFGGGARISNFALGGSARFVRAAAQRTPLRRIPLVGGALAGGIASTAKFVENTNFDVRRVGIGSITNTGGPGEHATFTDMAHATGEIRAGLAKGDLQNRQEEKRAQLQNELDRNKFNRLRGADEVPLSEGSQRYLAGLSSEQIIADHSLIHAMHHVADQLSPAQFEALMKSDKVADTDKQAMARNRFAQQIEISGQLYNEGNRDVIRRMSNKDLDLMAKHQPEAFANLMRVTNASGDTLTSGKQNDALEDNDNLTLSQKELIRRNTTRGKLQRFVDVANDGARSDVDRNLARRYANRFAGNLTPKEKGKLAGSFIRGNAEVYNNLTADDFREFQRDTKFTNANERRTLMANALATGANREELRTWLDNNKQAGVYWGHQRGAAPAARPARQPQQQGNRGQRQAPPQANRPPAGPPPPANDDDEDEEEPQP